MFSLLFPYYSEQKYKTKNCLYILVSKKSSHIMDMRPIPGTVPSRLPEDHQVFVSVYLYLCLVIYLSPSTSYTHPMIPTETKLFIIKIE